ncbi:uncharacterized protein LOC144247275 [Lonchura striata]
MGSGGPCYWGAPHFGGQGTRRWAWPPEKAWSPEGAWPLFVGVVSIDGRVLIAEGAGPTGATPGPGAWLRWVAWLLAAVGVAYRHGGRGFPVGAPARGGSFLGRARAAAAAPPPSGRARAGRGRRRRRRRRKGAGRGGPAVPRGGGHGGAAAAAPGPEQAPRYQEWILDTIDSLRSRKARPDLERICRMVRRRHGPEPERTRAELEKLIQQRAVLRVSYKGSISYRNAARVQPPRRPPPPARRPPPVSLRDTARLLGGDGRLTRGRLQGRGGPPAPPGAAAPRAAPPAKGLRPGGGGLPAHGPLKRRGPSGSPTEQCPRRWRGLSPRCRCPQAGRAPGRRGGPVQLHGRAQGQGVDPVEWSVRDVVEYFTEAGFPEQAGAFQEQEIDGKSLLLMQRADVLTGLSIRLGPALKIYEYHVKLLQRSHFQDEEPPPGALPGLRDPPRAAGTPPDPRGHPKPVGTPRYLGGLLPPPAAAHRDFGGGRGSWGSHLTLGVPPLFGGVPSLFWGGSCLSLGSHLSFEGSRLAFEGGLISLLGENPIFLLGVPPLFERGRQARAFRSAHAL